MTAPRNDRQKLKSTLAQTELSTHDTTRKGLKAVMDLANEMAISAATEATERAIDAAGRPNTGRAIGDFFGGLFDGLFGDDENDEDSNTDQDNDGNNDNGASGDSDGSPGM